MPLLLSEIQWSDPVLPVARDAKWEAEVAEYRKTWKKAYSP